MVAACATGISKWIESLGNINAVGTVLRQMRLLNSIERVGTIPLLANVFQCSKYCITTAQKFPRKWTCAYRPGRLSQLEPQRMPKIRHTAHKKNLYLLELSKTSSENTVRRLRQQAFLWKHSEFVTRWSVDKISKVSQTKYVLHGHLKLLSSSVVSCTRSAVEHYVDRAQRGSGFSLLPVHASLAGNDCCRSRP